MSGDKMFHVKHKNGDENMKVITRQELLTMLRDGSLEPHMLNSFYGLKPINMSIVLKRQERRIAMKPLTQSELETLKEAEDILFSRVDYGTNGVFDEAFCALYKALSRYYKLEKRDETCQNG